MTRLIDADALKEEMRKVFFNDNDDMLRLEKLIDNTPTVDIPNYGGQVMPDTLQGWRYEERPQGEWKIDRIGVYCSNCHTHPDFTFNFCPFCGADMRGKEV